MSDEASRLDKPVTVPPTEIEIAEAIKNADWITQNIVRRLAFQRDMLRQRCDELAAALIAAKNDRDAHIAEGFFTIKPGTNSDCVRRQVDAALRHYREPTDA